MRALAMACLLVLAVVPLAGAQNFAPQPPPPPRVGAPAATICSTDWGWCPLQTLAAPGGGCYCFVPPRTWLAGSARYWPYEGPVSPYLNPHTGPPSTIR
ncbi:MAG: hypothetical protein DMD78_23745 [Candidatus Rokuibacteriota bacterium]|nr:MAG: hypothetical protein DMD78_23745 [Candidatus Rokubacteria bacterium]